jgi:hypothetical protein
MGITIKCLTLTLYLGRGLGCLTEGVLDLLKVSDTKKR